MNSSAAELSALHPRVIMTLLAAVLEHENEDEALLDCVVIDGETFDLFRFDDPHVLMYTGLSATQVGGASFLLHMMLGASSVLCRLDCPLMLDGQRAHVVHRLLPCLLMYWFGMLYQSTLVGRPQRTW